MASRHVENSKESNQRTKHDSSELLHIDSVPSNVKFSQSIAMLHVFEDSEAVIKMINQGQESNNETCVKDSQSFSWLVIWQN